MLPNSNHYKANLDQRDFHYKIKKFKINNNEISLKIC